MKTTTMAHHQPSSSPPHSPKGTHRPSWCSWAIKSTALQGCPPSAVFVDVAVYNRPHQQTPENFHEQPSSSPFPSSGCLLYTSPSPRDRTRSRMPSSA